MTRCTALILPLLCLAACKQEARQETPPMKVVIGDGPVETQAPVSDEELAQLRQAAEARPDDAQAQDLYLAALLATGKASAALDRLQGTAATPQRQRFKGDALVMLGRYGEAANAYRAAGTLGDTPARLDDTLRLIGESAMQGKKWAEAAKAYEELRGRGATDPAILNNLAYAYGELGKYDSALPLARDAASRRPEDAAALDTWGWLLVKSGEDRAKGIALLERAAALAPADKAITAHLQAARKE